MNEEDSHPSIPQQAAMTPRTPRRSLGELLGDQLDDPNARLELEAALRR